MTRSSTKSFLKECGQYSGRGAGDCRGYGDGDSCSGCCATAVVPLPLMEIQTFEGW